MNIHLPAILGFTRYQGFDPSPYRIDIRCFKLSYGEYDEYRWCCMVLGPQISPIWIWSYRHLRSSTFHDKNMTKTSDNRLAEWPKRVQSANVPTSHRRMHSPERGAECNSKDWSGDVRCTSTPRRKRWVFRFQRDTILDLQIPDLCRHLRMSG